MKAILLAGGKGTRLRSEVPDLPKPMAPVCGLPFLEILMLNLVEKGIESITLSVGYRHEVIQEYFGTRFKNIKINYVIEDTPLGTGGALVKSLQSCDENEPVFVFNADTFIDLDLHEMYQAYSASEMDIAIALKRKKDTSRYGRVSIDKLKSQITGFEEKSGSEPGYINTGVYLLRKSFLNKIKYGHSFSLENDIFMKNFSQFSFFSYLTDGYFIDIGVPEDYRLAQHDMKKYL